MTLFETKHLLSKDSAQALQEAIDNLELLYMSGCFDTGIQATTYLLTSKIWQTSPQGHQYEQLIKLNKLFHLALHRSMDAFGNESAYSLEQLQQWATEKSQKTFASLVLIDPMPDKPFGQRWDSIFLDTLPLQKDSPDIPWRDRYGYLYAEIDAILKSRLRSRLEIQDSVGDMFSNMSNSLISILGQQMFEEEFAKEQELLKEEMKNHPHFNLIFPQTNPTTSSNESESNESDESEYALSLSIQELENLFLRLLTLQEPSPLEKERIDTLFVVHYLLDENIDSAVAFYEKSVDSLYIPQLNSLFCWEPMMRLYMTQKLGELYGITQEKAKSYFDTLQKRESNEPHIDIDLDIAEYNWAKAIDIYTNTDIDADYKIDYNPKYFERPSSGLTSIALSGKLTSFGAIDEQIKETENRLGMLLPPSYINFLKKTNGMLLPSEFVDLLPVEEIDFFYNLEPEWVDAWCKEDDAISDEKYNTYGVNQDTVWIRTSYLKNAIQISNTLEEDVLLLNPNIKFGEEWEAWYFGNKLPGAYRYRSFTEMINTLFSRVNED
jgi:hypothetical protein